MAPSLKKSSSSDLKLLHNAHKSPSAITLEDSDLKLNGRLILCDVPSNITLSPSPSSSMGSFLGFNSEVPGSRHVVHLGKLKNIRFMSIFCFKVWWSTLWIGTKGSDLQYETQFMILDECSSSKRPYLLLLPLIEGHFRASLQPSAVHEGDDDNIDICVESGSTKVTCSSFKSCLYMHAGTCPFDLVKDAMEVVRGHLGTFKLVQEKCPPRILEKFGWCTWDAFYLKVTPEGVLEGVKSLANGGCPPGFVIIDDGWKSMCHDDDDPMTEQQSMHRNVGGQQVPCRITNFLENYAFRSYKSIHDEQVKGMGALVKDLKTGFKELLEDMDVYVWHALCGFWGGIRPDVDHGIMPESNMVDALMSPSMMMGMHDGAVDGILKASVGLVPPEMAHRMFEGLHSYLDSVGIDGVKVDVIHVLEMLGEDYGGRVELAKAYFKAFDASVKKHFGGNRVIASMQQSNDFMFLGTQSVALGRVGDDFWSLDTQADPNGAFWLQGCHMVHCAYNSLWMCNFIHPDWDMFMSNHPCAKFHAASRAISGGPIYVSDAIGEHDFELLRALVLPDGSVLRCEHYALPTKDCLFQDPLHDGTTMLKIWNLNKYTGVLGAFNCQGGGWDPKIRSNKSAPEFSKTVSSAISIENIEWRFGEYPEPIKEVEAFAVYMFQAKILVFLRPTENIEISLDPFTFELLTVSPVRSLVKKMVHFAPIGLVNMLNTGGAVQSLSFEEEESLVRVGVKGAGEMVVVASKKPEMCRVDGEEVGFVYREEEKMVVVNVAWKKKSSDNYKLCFVEYLF